MVQIGNYHFGRAETASKPNMDTGEVFLLWDMLVSRYDINNKKPNISKFRS